MSTDCEREAVVMFARNECLGRCAGQARKQQAKGMHAPNLHYLCVKQENYRQAKGASTAVGGISQNILRECADLLVRLR